MTVTDSVLRQGMKQSVTWFARHLAWTRQASRCSERGRTISPVESSWSTMTVSSASWSDCKSRDWLDLFPLLLALTLDPWAKPRGTRSYWGTCSTWQSTFFQLPKRQWRASREWRQRTSRLGWLTLLLFHESTWSSWASLQSIAQTTPVLAWLVTNSTRPSATRTFATISSRPSSCGSSMPWKSRMTCAVRGREGTPWCAWRQKGSSSYGWWRRAAASWVSLRCPLYESKPLFSCLNNYFVKCIVDSQLLNVDRLEIDYDFVVIDGVNNVESRSCRTFVVDSSRQ